MARTWRRYPLRYCLAISPQARTAPRHLSAIPALMHPIRALAAGALAIALSSSTVPAQDSSVVSRAAADVHFHGFVEVYYRAGDPTTTDGYRLRKADLKVSGVLSPHLLWRVGFDGAKVIGIATRSDSAGAVTGVALDQRGRPLQDAAVTYVVNRSLQIDAGQQLLPLSLEGTIPTPQVETIERTMFIVERSRGTGFGDVRDIGVSLNGATASGLEYHAGVFNETGESQNATDANAQKAVIGRLVWHAHAIPGLQVGGSGAFEGGPAEQRRQRAGGEAQYATRRVTVRAEAMGGTDGALRRFGWYALTAVRPGRGIELVARADTWDRDLGAEQSVNDALERQIVAGASCAIDGGAGRVLLNLVHQSFPNVSAPRATFALVAFEAVW